MVRLKVPKSLIGGHFSMLKINVFYNKTMSLNIHQRSSIKHYCRSFLSHSAQNFLSDPSVCWKKWPVFYITFTYQRRLYRYLCQKLYLTRGAENLYVRGTLQNVLKDRYVFFKKPYLWKNNKDSGIHVFCRSFFFSTVPKNFVEGTLEHAWK